MRAPLVAIVVALQAAGSASPPPSPPVVFVPIHDHREVQAGGIFTLQKFAPIAFSLVTAEDVTTYLMAGDDVGVRRMVDAGRVRLIEDYAVVRVIEAFDFTAADKGAFVRARIHRLSRNSECS